MELKARANTLPIEGEAPGGVTRGYGVIEPLLARWRARMADRLIPQDHRSGKLLDIGCGRLPFFLASIEFAERCGLDKQVRQNGVVNYENQAMTLIRHDVERDSSLPFPDAEFSAVTMLAVFEHIEPLQLHRLMSEVHRVLRAGGIFVMTTPAAWADPLLQAMARLRLVSLEEIREHKGRYTRRSVARFVGEAGFPPDRVRTGLFELGLNLWATATK
jgi:SAM-dependent methyltransferase